MRVIVTGGTGFIGRHLVRFLDSQGHEVRTLSRRPEAPPGSREHCSCAVEGDDARKWARHADVIVHLAGLSDASLSVANPLEFNLVNALGSLNMLEAARLSGGAFLLASSQRVHRPGCEPVSEDAVPSPPDPYGWSKLISEHWMRMYSEALGVRTVAVRLFSVYGPGQRAGRGSSGVVSIFVQRALEGRDLIVRGESRRDFTFVSDAVRGMGLALQWLLEGHRLGTFNIATGRATSLQDLAALVIEVTGSASLIRQETGNDETYVADIRRARTELGYNPEVLLREGLERYAGWYAQNIAEGQADS